MLGKDVFRNRLEQVLSFMGESGADIAILTPSPNFQYLTGIETEMRERLVALLVTKDGEAKIVSPSFEVPHYSHQTWIEDFIPWEEDENPYTQVANCVDRNDSSLKVLVDESLPIGVYWSFEKAFDGFQKSTSLIPKLDAMRLVKSEEEIELMKKAGRIIDDAVTTAFQKAELGITEIELRQIVHNVISQAGATPTFAAIQFGENSALPHAGPSQRKLRKSDIVLMDCGCSLEGYNTDMTRVGVAGNPTEEQEKVYSIVLQSEEAAIARLEPGFVCGAADGVARRVIDEAGYGEYFTHRLGHGIGIEVHEPPYLVRGNSLELQVGMTHSVEPGIYLEGLFGIRIEDLVCIRQDGAEVITYTPKDLYRIDV
ncbi:MAG: Xaa-Pro peptidase family protein [Candidatus Thorarchaeota archaeon]